jgi:hypothetical protein
MHGSIRDRLEDLLSAEQLAMGHQGLAEHLSSCHECSSELAGMRTQSEAIRTLRTAEELDPAPGFYARVMQRIEERAKDSIWSGFIGSPVAARLAYASLTLAVVFGTYVVTHESRDGHLRGDPIIAQALHYDAPVFGSQAQQRDAVLENFASH